MAFEKTAGRPETEEPAVRGSSLSSRRRSVAGVTSGYAAASDFCQLFQDRMDGLYLLALLLTANHRQAEACFVAGLEDCTRASAVFRAWAETWAKRTIVINGIRMVSPIPNEIGSMKAICGVANPISDACALFAGIIQLQPFERFVYVMSVLEGYSDHDCARLLRCGVGAVIDARRRAFEQLSDHEARVDPRIQPEVRSGNEMPERSVQIAG